MSKKGKAERDGGLSLAPLDFREAVAALMKVRPDEDRQKRGEKPPNQDAGATRGLAAPARSARITSSKR